MLTIINQFRGLGDIIFCEPIASYYAASGHKVLWPIIPQFLNIQKHYNNVSFISKDILNIDYNSHEWIKKDNYQIIPLRFSDSIMKDGGEIESYYDCMFSKYLLVQLPLYKWRDSNIIRDIKSEDELFYNVLGLQDGEEYNFVNNIFKTDSAVRQNMPPVKGKVVNMQILPEYTLIDWSKVIENATCIHTVSSSIFYLLELLSMKANEIHLYDRPPEEIGFRYIDYLFTKNYILHETKKQ